MGNLETDEQLFNTTPSFSQRETERVGEKDPPKSSFFTLQWICRYVITSPTKKALEFKETEQVCNFLSKSSSARLDLPVSGGVC